MTRLVKEYPDDDRPPELVTLHYLKQRRDAVAHPDKVSQGVDAEATLLSIRSLIKDIQPVLEQLPGLSVEEAQAELAEARARVTADGEDRAQVERDQQRALAKCALAKAATARGGAI